MIYVWIVISVGDIKTKHETAEFCVLSKKLNFTARIQFLLSIERNKIYFVAFFGSFFKTQSSLSEYHTSLAYDTMCTL